MNSLCPELHSALGLILATHLLRMLMMMMVVQAEETAKSTSISCALLSLNLPYFMLHGRKHWLDRKQ